MTDGAFSPGARAAIYALDDGRCIGCGRTDLSAQHRRGRQSGGTSLEDIGHPANGLPLCGGALAGVVGCHGWTERHPILGVLLGWRLLPDQPALGTPFWTRTWSWRAWTLVDGWPHHTYIDPDTELPNLTRHPNTHIPDRAGAVDLFRAARLTKTTTKSRRTA